MIAECDRQIRRYRLFQVLTVGSFVLPLLGIALAYGAMTYGGASHPLRLTCWLAVSAWNVDEMVRRLWAKRVEQGAE